MKLIKFLEDLMVSEDFSVDDEDISQIIEEVEALKKINIDLEAELDASTKMICDAKMIINQLRMELDSYRKLVNELKTKVSTIQVIK